MKKLLLISSAIVVAGIAIYLFSTNNTETTDVKPEFATTKRGDMLINLKESGFLNAVEELTIKNEISFNSLKITEVISDGSYVEEGDFLIALDTEPLIKEKTRIETSISDRTLAVTEAQNTLEITKSEIASSVTAAKNEIEFAKLNLQKFEKLDKVRQLDEALTEINIATQDLKFSEQSYSSSLELAEKGFETKSRVDRDSLELTTKQKKLKSAKARYDILKDFDLHKEGLGLTRKLEEARSKYERMKKEGENKTQKARARLDNATSLLKRTKVELEKLVEQISKAEIKSSISGYALYPKKRYHQDVKIEKGKSVSRNQTLFRIPDMTNMKVDIEIPEHFISDLAVGQKAIVTIDSLKGRQFPGKVGNIGLLPIQSRSWMKSHVQKYNVIINIADDTLPKTIKPQISASAEIILDTLKGVLSIPIQAVHTVKGKQVVFVRKGSSMEYQQREIKIGKMDTNYMQVVSGLKEGEQVLISEPSF